MATAATPLLTTGADGDAGSATPGGGVAGAAILRARAATRGASVRLGDYVSPPATAPTPQSARPGGAYRGETWAWAEADPLRGWRSAVAAPDRDDADSAAGAHAGSTFSGSGGPGGRGAEQGFREMSDVPGSWLEDWEDAGDGTMYVLDSTAPPPQEDAAAPTVASAGARQAQLSDLSTGRNQLLLPPMSWPSPRAGRGSAGGGTDSSSDHSRGGVGHGGRRPGAGARKKEVVQHAANLGQLAATAIAGNDITSSCLYVCGLCASSAGKLAPVCLLLVGFILHLFRGVYGEVVSALPVNGGAYTALLNSTTKAVASTAACLALLSYVATGVVSAADAVVYATRLAHVPLLPTTVAVLFFFALLSFWGITDSARVASMMFIAHLATMVTLMGFGFYTAMQDDWKTFADNMAEPLPDIAYDVAGGARHVIAVSSIAGSIFFGTSSAMLGVSGFETSSNMVEDMRDTSVYLKSLRNTWYAVVLLNPALSAISMGVLSPQQIKDSPDDLLAEMAHESGGDWLHTLVCVDATVVLSGAVLTAYVGVTGLTRRMAMDRVLPQFLLRVNEVRGTNHFIIASFLFIASSLFLVLRGDVSTLAEVYTTSFLGVMALFAIANLLLKWKRPRMRRDVRSSWLATCLGLLFVVMGLLGNLLRSPEGAQYFVLYFLCTSLVVFVMFQRIRLLRILLYGSRWAVGLIAAYQAQVSDKLTRAIVDIQSAPLLFFAKSDDLPTLNKAVLYVRDNEQTQRLIIVHVCEREEDVPPHMVANVRLIDSLYPKLRIDFLFVRGTFGPAVVRFLARELGVPTNLMFIAAPESGDGGSPGAGEEDGDGTERARPTGPDRPLTVHHSVKDLGGMRVISRPRPRHRRHRMRMDTMGPSTLESEGTATFDTGAGAGLAATDAGVGAGAAAGASAGGDGGNGGAAAETKSATAAVAASRPRGASGGGHAAVSVAPAGGIKEA